MISIIGAPAASLLIIYVLLWGAGIASGQIQEPFTDGMRRILRMVVIVCFALSVGIYSSQIVSFFLQIPSSFAVALISTPGAGVDAPSIATVIDVSINQGFQQASMAWAMASTDVSYGQAFGFIVISIIMYASTMLVGAVATAMLFVAYIALAVALAIGPLFILAALFQSTQRFFELWLGQVLNFCILFLLIALCISLTFTMFRQFMVQMGTQDFNELIINAFKIMGMCVCIVVVMLQTRGMASALGGGVALAGQNVAGRLGSALGGAYGNMKGANRARQVGDSRGAAYATPLNARLAAMIAAPGSAVVARARQTWHGRNSVSEG
jgi:type IV secretion system protein VirB6